MTGTIASFVMSTTKPLSLPMMSARGMNSYAMASLGVGIKLKFFSISSISLGYPGKVSILMINVHMFSPKASLKNGISFSKASVILPSSFKISN